MIRHKLLELNLIRHCIYVNNHLPSTSTVTSSQHPVSTNKDTAAGVGTRGCSVGALKTVTFQFHIKSFDYQTSIILCAVVVFFQYLVFVLRVSVSVCECACIITHLPKQTRSTQFALCVYFSVAVFVWIFTTTGFTDFR